MTVNELIAQLQKLDGELQVYKAKDAEGNGYDPVCAVDSDCHIRTSEIGSYYVDTLPSWDDLMYEDEDPEEFTKVVGIW